MKYLSWPGLVASVFALFTLASVQAEELKVGKDSYPILLYKDKPFLHVVHNDRSIKVQRVQDPDFVLKGYFAKTARKCPPFCLRYMDVDEGVVTVGERELFDFMENELRDGSGVLVDARTAAWHKKGTIPGSVHIPFTVFGKTTEDLELLDALESFGAVKRDEVSPLTAKLEEWGFLDGDQKTAEWDFSQAKDLLLYCNGPECGQSPKAIEGLLKHGYPAEKLLYYRGGMQLWQLWGLTTVAGDEE